MSKSGPPSPSKPQALSNNSPPPPSPSKPQVLSNNTPPPNSPTVPSLSPAFSSPKQSPRIPHSPRVVPASPRVVPGSPNVGSHLHASPRVVPSPKVNQPKNPAPRSASTTTPIAPRTPGSVEKRREELQAIANAAAGANGALATLSGRINRLARTWKHLPTGGSSSMRSLPSAEELALGPLDKKHAVEESLSIDEDISRLRATVVALGTQLGLPFAQPPAGGGDKVQIKEADLLRNGALELEALLSSVQREVQTQIAMCDAPPTLSPSSSLRNLRLNPDP